MRKIGLLVLVIFLFNGCTNKNIKALNEIKERAKKYPIVTEGCERLRNEFLKLGTDSPDKKYRVLKNNEEFKRTMQLFMALPRSSSQLLQIHTDAAKLEPTPEVVSFQVELLNRHCNAVIPYFVARALTLGTNNLKLDKSVKQLIMDRIVPFLLNETLYRPSLLNSVTNLAIFESLLESNIFDADPKQIKAVKAFKEGVKDIRKDIVKKMADSHVTNLKISKNISKDQARTYAQVMKYEVDKTIEVREQLVNLIRKIAIQSPSKKTKKTEPNK